MIRYLITIIIKYLNQYKKIAISNDDFRNKIKLLLFELLICIIISHIYYLNDGYFGLFHPYYLYLILPIIFFVAKFVATVRLE